MNAILDTPILIELIKPEPDPKVINFFVQKRQDDFFISVFTIAEIFRKIRNLPGSNKKKALELWIMELAQEFNKQILEVDSKSAIYFELNLKEKMRAFPQLDFSFFINLSLSFSKGLPMITFLDLDLSPFSDVQIHNLFAG